MSGALNGAVGRATSDSSDDAWLWTSDSSKMALTTFQVRLLLKAHPVT